MPCMSLCATPPPPLHRLGEAVALLSFIHVPAHCVNVKVELNWIEYIFHIQLVFSNCVSLFGWTKHAEEPPKISIIIIIIEFKSLMHQAAGKHSPIYYPPLLYRSNISGSEPRKTTLITKRLRIGNLFMLRWVFQVKNRYSLSYIGSYFMLIFCPFFFRVAGGWFGD